MTNSIVKLLLIFWDASKTTIGDNFKPQVWMTLDDSIKGFVPDGASYVNVSGILQPIPAGINV